MSDSPIQPIFLLADSQLLFHRGGSVSLLERVRVAAERDAGPGGPCAAYVGASNGDEPAFYELFAAAMDTVGISQRRMIPSVPSAQDRAFLDRAELIVLAGGDVERGWQAMKQSGLVESIVGRFAAGAVLLGVSAGAVQLGLCGWRDGSGTRPRVFETFRLVPHVIDAHAEPDWQSLGEVVRAAGNVRGLGIPTGGAAVIHPNLEVEAVRRPLTEVRVVQGAVRQALLLPPEAPDGEVWHTGPIVNGLGHGGPHRPNRE